MRPRNDRLLLLLLLPGVQLTTGCNEVFGTDVQCRSAGGSDGSLLPLRICLDDQVPARFAVPADGAMLDTDTAPECTPYVGDDPGLCVVAATDIQIAGTLRAVGSRPLVLLATSSIHLSGTIDVAGDRTTQAPGAGSMCEPGDAMSRGGGAGGSFQGRGGNGGDANVIGGGSIPAEALAEVTTLRGGCGGSSGENAGVPTRGRGGGAVYLMANISITITDTGTINASGGAGAGGLVGTVAGGGGGGGGSGGMIGLDAARFEIDPGARMFANGGGGGEGASAFGPGADGRAPGNPDEETGSADTGTGGNGGRGSYADVPRGAVGGRGAIDSPNLFEAGGGGGGGGAGFVVVFPRQFPGGMIAPPPT